MTRHLNLDEQADLGSLTTQIIADGAVTADKISPLESYNFALDVTVGGILIVTGGLNDPRTYLNFPAGSLRPEYISTATTDNFTFPNALIATTFTIEANGATPPGPNSIGGVTTMIGDGVNTLIVTNGNIDLSFNQALKFRLENVVADPVSAGHPGRLFWNTTEQTIKVDTGSTFVPLAAVAGAVTGIAADANPYLTSNIQFLSGTGINLSQVGQTITINSTSVATPGGANTELQFNNAGSFGGISALTWDGVNLNLSALLIATNGIQVSQNSDFGQYQLKSAALDNVSGTPGGPSTGQFWFDTNDATAKYWDGTSVKTMSGVSTPPAGSTTQIQYNNAGAFGADSGLTYDSGNVRIHLNDGSPAVQFNNAADTTMWGIVGANVNELFLETPGASQNITIQTNNGASVWVFDPNGTITLPGDAHLSDDKKIFLNAALDSFIKYSTPHAGMVLSAGPGGNFNTEGQFALWANTLSDGSGTYSPALVLNAADGINISTATGGVLIDDDLTGSGPVASAKLEVKSLTRGFLPPRLNTTQRDAIASPATGLQIYNTTTNQPEVYNGTVWTSMGSSLTAANFVKKETPAGVIDGSNTIFTLAFLPVVGSEEVYLNGVQQDEGPGNDYTISGSTITFAVAPISPDKVRVSYIK